MKILHVAPSISRSYGGPTQTLASYLSASRTIGAEADVAGPAGDLEDQEFLERSGARAIRTFPGYGAGGTAMSPSLIRWIGAASRGYDVVHVHGLFNFISSFAARTAIAKSACVVIRPFGTLSRYTFGHRRSRLKRAWFRMLDEPNLRRAAAVHFTSDTERDEAARHGLALGPRAHVVPPAFMPPAAVSHRSAAQRDVVLFIGRFHPVKNLEALVDAWPSVLERCPDAVLILAGDGAPAYREGLIRRAQRLAVSGKVNFPGFLSGSSKADAISRASLLVLPSFHENFGVAVLEGIAAGLPVVISPHVHLRDFVDSHRFGVIAGDSGQSLADSIVDGLTDTGLKERVARDGRPTVEATFGAETVGRALHSMYLAACEQADGQSKHSTTA